MKVGDLVRVKDNLRAGTFYRGVVFDKDMEEYRGKIGAIIEYSCDGYIIIDGFNDHFGMTLIWSVDMLEPVRKEFTIYSISAKFFIEKGGVFTEIEDVSTIENVMSKYPKQEQVCYGIEFNNLKYCAYKFKWYDSEPKRKLFDAGHIFTDKEKAQEVADKFNEIIDNK